MEGAKGYTLQYVMNDGDLWATDDAVRSFGYWLEPQRTVRPNIHS